jgi:hypothetical protein
MMTSREFTQTESPTQVSAIATKISILLAIWFGCCYWYEIVLTTMKCATISNISSTKTRSNPCGVGQDTATIGWLNG